MPKTLESPADVDAFPTGAILDAEVVAATQPQDMPIRLNHLNNERHDIRHPTLGWFSFNNYVLVVESREDQNGQEFSAEQIASWLEDVVGRDVVKRDNLPEPLSCLVCQANGQAFSTKCLEFYAKHMYLAHS